jgi:transcriptional regulator CtsR
MTEPTIRASEQLAGKIIQRLIDEKLLSANDGKKLVPKMATGKVRAEDWRLAVEKSVPEVSSDEFPS